MKEKLDKIYKNRFSGLEDYRNSVWQILINDFFIQWINQDSVILDLGCGYGEFINNIDGCRKHAMDLNPDTRKILKKEILFHEQDCSKPWPLDSESLDLIFTSNFFEHLPNKETLDQTISHAHKHLKKNGCLVMIGPNIAALKGHYWDFWDHHVALSDQSAAELLELHEFTVEKKISRFLPYNMVRIRKRPLFLVRLYLRLHLVWRFFGSQFLIVARKN